jgi:hypothetical protein
MTEYRTRRKVGRDYRRKNPANVWVIIGEDAGGGDL